jgi:hypothetical protein
MSPEAIAPRGRSRAWHVTGPCRTCDKGRAARFGPRGRRYRRGDAPPPPLSRRRRLLPRHVAREQRLADRAGRWRPGALRPHPPARRASLRVADARPLSDGEPLPPGRRDSDSQPLGRHARPQRRVCPRLQRAPRPPRPRVRPPLLGEADRVGGAVQRDHRVRRQQPPPPRLRQTCRPVALDVGAGSPSDRFASCRTTPTS